MGFGSGVLHGIIGPAGAGKTTFLRILLKLLNCDHGTVEYHNDGSVLEFEEFRKHIAYMPQQQSLYADLSIKEHLEFFRDMYGLNKKVYKEKSQNLLEMTRLDKFLNRPAGKLSGGMYKKLGLMCALLRSPKVIFLDEPTNGVDPISRREFWDILNEAVLGGILVIMTTAYMDEAERCGYVHLIEHGTLIDKGEPMAMLNADEVNDFDEFFIKRSKRMKQDKTS